MLKEELWVFVAYLLYELLHFGFLNSERVDHMPHKIRYLSGQSSHMNSVWSSTFRKVIMSFTDDLLHLYLKWPNSLDFIPSCDYSRLSDYDWLGLTALTCIISLFACLPLAPLFIHYAHLTVMISLSRERGHRPSQSLALRFGTSSVPRHDPLY